MFVVLMIAKIWIRFWLLKELLKPQQFETLKSQVNKILTVYYIKKYVNGKNSFRKRAPWGHRIRWAWLVKPTRKAKVMDEENPPTNGLGNTILLYGMALLLTPWSTILSLPIKHRKVNLGRKKKGEVWIPPRWLTRNPTSGSLQPLKEPAHT